MPDRNHTCLTAGGRRGRSRPDAVILTHFLSSNIQDWPTPHGVAWEPRLPGGVRGRSGSPGGEVRIVEAAEERAAALGAESEAFPSDGDDMAVVEQPVQVAATALA